MTLSRLANRWCSKEKTVRFRRIRHTTMTRRGMARSRSIRVSRKNPRCWESATEHMPSQPKFLGIYWYKRQPQTSLAFFLYNYMSLSEKHNAEKVHETDKAHEIRVNKRESKLSGRIQHLQMPWSRNTSFENSTRGSTSEVMISMWIACVRTSRAGKSSYCEQSESKGREQAMKCGAETTEPILESSIITSFCQRSDNEPMKRACVHGCILSSMPKGTEHENRLSIGMHGFWFAALIAQPKRTDPVKYTGDV